MASASLLAAPKSAGPLLEPIDASLELGAYEALWRERKVSFKSIAETFASHSHTRPSDLVPEDDARLTGQRVVVKFRQILSGWFNLKLRGEFEYPSRLRDATYPVELLYYQGWWDLIDTPSIAVVGTRNPSEDGVLRTQRLVQNLLSDSYTIVSGLAKGIDTAAHETAIAEGGQTFAVIGTPLGHCYPKSNMALQKEIAKHFLLISQIPLERYEAQNPRTNRFFFPERNKTMSALTLATIIVEASETSGTLLQAKEALKQGRKLFILNNCFENPNLSWPSRFEKMGAVRVREYDDIRQQLATK